MARTSMQREYGTLPRGGSRMRSSFDISETRKATFDGDRLVPIYWNYFYPGDVLRGSVQGFCRMLSALDTPMMDNAYLNVHWYAAPIRILWDNARKFFGEQDNPGDSIDYSIPTYGSATNWDTSLDTEINALAWHLDVPIRTAAQGGVDENDISALPFRAYQHIYNWHYRQQQQQNSDVVATGDGPDDAENSAYHLKFRGKRHDYFTMALPAPQRGEALTLDIETDADNNDYVGIWANTYEEFRRLSSDVNEVDLDTVSTADEQTNRMYAGTINDLRNAASIQKFLERDNRYGTRFNEQIYSHYGVEFNDIRISPLYLGGGRGYISTSAIPNQSATTGNLGDLAAIAHGGIDGARFTYAVDEPCIVMAIAVATADQTYQQGLPYKHSLRTRYEMFYPEFTGIGDRAMLTKELYYQNTADDDIVFGYIPRYEERRIGLNRAVAEFNSNHISPLDTWHLAYQFASRPVLGNTWAQASTQWARVQAVASADDFIADFRINLRLATQMPTNGVPGIGIL